MKKPVQEELPLFAVEPPGYACATQSEAPADSSPESAQLSSGGGVAIAEIQISPWSAPELPDAETEPAQFVVAGNTAVFDTPEPPYPEAVLEAFPTPAVSEPFADAFRRHPERALIVSIHDVSPHTRPAVERILAEFEALGVCEFSLLVVADHHRRGHIFDDPEFCRWLQRRVARGDEAVIHGYFHHRDQRPGESLREKVTTRFYTKGEGEFFDIPGANALRIVSDARAEFRKLGLAPRGFIAPAWLLSEGGELALRTLEFDYTTRLGTVEDFACNRIYHSQSLVWSVRSAWRRWMSRCWNAILFRRLQNNGLMRIGIHPPDIEHSAVWRQILQLTRRALADRTPVSYQRWIESSRNTAHVLKS